VSWTLLPKGSRTVRSPNASISREKTVKNYVSNLLTKLDMQRRTQAAVYAVRLHDRGQSDPGPEG
jgi:hypothetical protein